MMDTPDGFSPHFRRSPLTDPWQPLYSKQTDNAVIIGLRADDQHCNGRGFVHGGLISALADNAMGLSCVMQHDTKVSLVTLSLHMDFLRSAQRGQWLEFVTTFTKIGASVDVAQGHVSADGRHCALFSATFTAYRPRSAASD